LENQYGQRRMTMGTVDLRPLLQQFEYDGGAAEGEQTPDEGRFTQRSLKW
jgi:hypothetical protein